MRRSPKEASPQNSITNHYHQELTHAFTGQSCQKGILVKTLIAFSILLMTSLPLTAVELEYRFKIFLFSPTESYQLVEDGAATTKNCRHLFDPPSSYNGRFIQIPENATPFGIAIVTKGNSAEVIPLYTWVDDRRARQYGCNGPTLRYAMQNDSQKEFLNEVKDLLNEK